MVKKNEIIFLLLACLLSSCATESTRFGNGRDGMGFPQTIESIADESRRLDDDFFRGNTKRINTDDWRK